jgi:pimeloyl-ACP methyl ester carboxylesterase
MLKNFARASGRCAELEAIYQAPRSWTERAYRKLNYFNEVDKGGHFTAWEQPQLFAEEMRAALRSLRYLD